jgi:hypothetical protein
MTLSNYMLNECKWCVKCNRLEIVSLTQFDIYFNK